jgi:predicted NAD/FAD-dependent oxidoreductase
MSRRVAVVGAGIVGLAAASALRRAGIAARGLERLGMPLWAAAGRRGRPAHHRPAAGAAVGAGAAGGRRALSLSSQRRHVDRRHPARAPGVCATACRARPSGMLW